MSRYVRITIIYDMDDPNKPLNDELREWYYGDVRLSDIFTEEFFPCVEGDSIRIEDLSAERDAEAELKEIDR